MNYVELASVLHARASSLWVDVLWVYVTSACCRLQRGVLGLQEGEAEAALWRIDIYRRLDDSRRSLRRRSPAAILPRDPLWSAAVVTEGR